MKVWKMNLTCITPVHIGSGVSYKPIEYIYIPSDQDNIPPDLRNKIYFLNESNWLSYLQVAGKELIDKFANYSLESENLNKSANNQNKSANNQNKSANYQNKLANKQNKSANNQNKSANNQNKSANNQNKSYSIFNWLYDISLSGRFGNFNDILSKLIERHAVYPAEPVYGNNNSLNSVNPFIRSGNGECYIPGSSIKGAIRTALLAYDIKQNSANYKKYWLKAEQLADYSGNIKDKLKDLTDKIEKEFCCLKEQDEGYNNQNPALNDLFRYLQVSDAIAYKPLKMGIVQKVDLSINESEPKTLPLCRECIMPGNALSFTISVDDKKVERLGASNIEDILNALQDFVKLQYELQADVYKGVESELVDFGGSNLVLGGGTGYLSKTILYALAVSQSKNDIEKENVIKKGRRNGVSIVRKFMEAQFPDGGHGKKYELSPHTFKLTSYENKTALMGLCKVEKVQELNDFVKS